MILESSFLIPHGKTGTLPVLGPALVIHLRCWVPLNKGTQPTTGIYGLRWPREYETVSFCSNAPAGPTCKIFFEYQLDPELTYTYP